MIKARPAKDRGQANFGWLNSQHSFSFGEYYDPEHMGFGVLRVINEDRIKGGTGFGTHPHQNMEIISYVISGALKHQDSMGNKTIITPGEIQRMSAGTGVIHSEYNNLTHDETHFLQIWIIPDRHDYKPSYGQMNFESKITDNQLNLLVSRDGRNGSISINQDAFIYLGRSAKKDSPLNVQTYNHQTDLQRLVWVQVIRGELTVLNHNLKSGDGLGLSNCNNVLIEAAPDTEFLLFDMVKMH